MLYPIMTVSRALCDLGGDWDFMLDDGQGFLEEWYCEKLKNPMKMPVPSSYNDMKEDHDFKEFCGWAFYQKTFSLPGMFKDQRIIIRFAAVTHIAKVYLNGQLICEHKGGFLPFEADITDRCLEGDNLLTVAVDNRIDYTTLPVGVPYNRDGLEGKKPRNYPLFDFFNYAGITRSVKIYTTPKDYIADIALTSEMSGTDARIFYHVDTAGKGKTGIKVYDRSGKCIAAAEGQDGELIIKGVQLWQPLNAYLYQIEVTFGDDVYTLPYGIRTVKVQGTQFLINGKPFYFKGYGKHEDTFPNGRGMNLAMNAKDISLMKWQGANSFRTSHYPYSEEMMRLCDEEGIVVIDETPGVGINFRFGGGANFGGMSVPTYDAEKGIKTFEHHKEVIGDLIKRDKNHACVVMWSIANEADMSGPGARDYFKPLMDLARNLDPERRPCTLVSEVGDGVKTNVAYELADVICLNRYYGWYIGGGELEEAVKGLRKELAEWESCKKPVMYTEYGADTISGLHDTVPVMFTEEYQLEYYKMNHAIIDECPFFVGEQVWNFADFATSQGIVRVQGNKKGIFTRDRKPKLAAHYFKDRWSKIPDFGYKD